MTGGYDDVRRPDDVFPTEAALYRFAPATGEAALLATRLPVDLKEVWMAMPSVLNLLEQISQGNTTATEAAAMLAGLAAEIQPIGCCLNCTSNLEAYEQNWARYEAARAAFAGHLASLTPESHPYGVTKSGGIHTWDCRAVPTETIVQPGRLTDFTHGGIGYTYEGSRRVTTDELVAWMADRAPYVRRRCKSCQPALPGAYTSEASDVA